MKKIVCFHLYNDYSGSPRVLAMILKGLQKKGYSIDIITSNGGILNQLMYSDKIKFKLYKYHFSTNKWHTTLSYLFIQLYTFIWSFKYLFKKDIVFYINTILPVGPALAGFLMRKEVIYHCHENVRTSNKFYFLLGKIMGKIAKKIICVSSFQSKQIITKKDIIVVPNSVSSEFYEHFKSIKEKELSKEKTVLMLSSLKIYKGIKEFFQLAQLLPQYKFTLVINDEQKNIDIFLAENKISQPFNLKIYSQQKNIIPFYEHSSLLISLSNPKLIIETFGLTAIEGMTAALPIIAPTIGGIADVVNHGIDGFKLDVNNIQKIAEYINRIFTDSNLYSKLSINAKKNSENYNYNKMLNQIINIIETK